ncbi:MAG: CRISPR-associated RAMP protein Csx7 [Candidatus Caldarchaeales archaeon]
MTMYWTSSRVLLRETVIEGELVNLSPLRIGAGEDTPLSVGAGAAVVKVRIRDSVVPYIPGSSLKGVFRATSEAVARQKGLDVCSGLSRSTCMHTKRYTSPQGGLDLLEGIEEYGEEGRDRNTLMNFVMNELRQGRPDAAMEAFFRNACLMCKIFGAPLYASKVVFSDAYPIGKVSLGARTGVAISRKTGAVAVGPYIVEYVEPGARFAFSVTLRNLPNYALGLISSVVMMLRDGEVRVGGYKTRGFGRVTVENLTFRNREFTDKPSMMRGLEEGRDRDLDVSDLVTVKDGWAVCEGDRCLELLKRLVEVWEGAKF